MDKATVVLYIPEQDLYYFVRALLFPRLRFKTVEQVLV